MSIAPIEGEPAAIAAELGAATARALLGVRHSGQRKSDRPAAAIGCMAALSDRTRGGKSAVAVIWRLQDARGREIGERAVGIEGTADEWQSAGGAMIERLAELSAEAVAPLLVKATGVPETRRPSLDALPNRPRPDRAADAAAGTAPAEAAAPGAGGLKPAVPDLPSAKPAAPGGAGGSRHGAQAGKPGGSGSPCAA